MVNRKGLSSAIALLILIVLIIVVAVPFLMYLQYLQQSTQVSNAIINNYVSLKQLQYSAVISGHPAIYFLGSTQKGLIIFEYTNGTFVPPINLTITGILYLDNGVWENITSFKYPIIVSAQASISLPKYASNVPIVIVTSLGNIFYLVPNSSIGPYSPTSNGGVEIIAQLYTKNSIYSPVANVTTNIMGKFENYSLPVAFPNETGTFEARVPQYVYYEFPNGTIMTGVFHNWYIQGKAIVNSTTSQGIKVTLQHSSVVLIANYTELIIPVTLNIQVIEPNAPSIQQVTVEINGKEYQVPGSVSVLAGYVSVDIITQLFNNTVQMSQGYIYTYKYEYSSYQNKQYTLPSYLIFIPPTSYNQNLYIYYEELGYYVQVQIEEQGCSNPNEVNFQLNGTVYNFGGTYWIWAGNYYMGLVGIFYAGYNSGYCVGPQYIYYNNAEIYNYLTSTNTIIDINQPGTIVVDYGIIANYQRL